MNTTLIIAVSVFLITYGIIISEKVHRTVVALAGAMLMILLGVINQEQAIHGIDFNTLGLLIGMMVIVSIAKDSGIFQYLAIATSRVGRGNPAAIFLLLGLLTAVFSAFLDNVTTVVLLVPVVFVITNNLKISPIPFLIGLILFSNIGGAATLIGDPPNILIGSAAGLSFNDFLVNIGPLSLLLLAVVGPILYLIYRKQLVADITDQQRIIGFKAREAITDPKLLRKSLFVIAVVLLGFFTHTITHLEGATIALAGAALLLLLTMNDPENHLKEIEWTTIFFFIGLFILVAALESVGVIEAIAQQLVAATNGNQRATVLAILWGSGALSAIVDNIPFVATAIPIIQEFGHISHMPLEPLWWALAIGADIGGNATVVGASANMVVKGMAENEGYKVTFWRFCKVATPITILCLVISSVYMVVRYL